MKTLDLVVPGLLGPFSADIPGHFSQALKQKKFQGLQQCLSRARLEARAETNYPATLFSRLPTVAGGVENSLSDLSAAYDNIQIESGYLYRADPVHFKAESDHAILLDADVLNIARAEADQLIELFNRHFAEDGIQLIAGSATRWYLRTERPLALNFVPLEDALGRDIKHFMPGGEDALWWRKTLNEAQMLFFQHSLNQQREAEGRLSINGLWLWDMSLTRTAPASHEIIPVFADTELPAILASAVNDSRPLSELSALQTNRGLVVTERFYSAFCYGDLDAWFEALDNFVQGLFAEILCLLKTEQVHRLDIYPCDGRVFQLHRRQLYKIWLRPQPVTHFFPEVS